MGPWSRCPRRRSPRASPPASSAPAAAQSSSPRTPQSTRRSPSGSAPTKNTCGGRARPRGPLPQDVRAPRQGRGAGPRHGAVHLLRSQVARLHLVTTAGLVTHGPGYSFRRLHRHLSLRLGFLISPSDALGYLYKICIVMCTFSWVWCGVRIFSAVGSYYYDSSIDLSCVVMLLFVH